MPKVGIAITTTPDRVELFEKTLKHIQIYSPQDSFIFVNNDVNREGVNISKNNCIAALMNKGCEHLFLFDDDCYPLNDFAFDIFIKSGLNHACLTFGEKANKGSNINLIRTINGIDHFTNARGVMLYFTRKAIDLCGGMDIAYSRYGFEHLGLTNRIYNRGLIPGQYICPSGALPNFYCYDLESREHKPLFNFTEKMALTNKARPLFVQERKSMDWKPYQRGNYKLLSWFKKEAIANEIDGLLKHDYTVLFTDSKRASKDNDIKYVYSQISLGHKSETYKYIIFYDWIVKNKRYIDTVTIIGCKTITAKCDVMIESLNRLLIILKNMRHISEEKLIEMVFLSHN